MQQCLVWLGHCAYSAVTERRNILIFIILTTVHSGICYQIRACHQVGAKSYECFDNKRKKNAMEPKTHLAASSGALGVRNHYLACFSEIFMLRLIPQLLRSSEIELFEGQARPLRRNFWPQPSPGEEAGWVGTTFHTLDIRKSVDSEQILVRKCQESLAEWYLVVWKSATDNFLRFWRHNSER